MMDFSKVTQQDKIKPRDAPYWRRIAAGRHLGLRKTPTSITWLARAYDPATRKQVKRSLGDFGDLPQHDRFTAAAEAAGAWFEHLDQGGSTQPITVNQACERYVNHLRDLKGDVAATEAYGYVRRFIHDDNIANVEVGKLQGHHLKDWRRRMAGAPAIQPRRGTQCRVKSAPPPPAPRSSSSINRNMVFLRAALNLAKDDGFATTDNAWIKPLKPIKGADRRRNIYLDREQRAALIAALPADFVPFVRGLCLLPLRPGALAALTVADLDTRNKKLCIGKDKAGENRVIPLPDSAVKLLSEQARSKLPGAHLFTRWDGTAWRRDSWKGPIKAAVIAVGLPPGTTAYTLRHSTISDLVTAGLDLFHVAKLSGTSVAMIEAHYGTVRDDLARTALEGLAL